MSTATTLDLQASQLVFSSALKRVTGTSAGISVTLPPSGSYTFIIPVGGAVTSSACTASPNKSLGANVGFWFRAVVGGVEVRLKNLSTTTSAAVSSAIFTAVAFPLE